jgi:aromatic-L-amino-acid/L-tryptophan decarboxylase
MDGVPRLGEMDLAEFRKHGHYLIDWIADYLAHPEDYPVLSRSHPGEIKSQIPPAPPSAPEEMDAILADFEKIILPGVTHWNHPAFFAYFGISGSGPGILGELLSAGLNVNAMLWRTSPAATELEEVVLDWLRQILGLPDEFRGVIVDTASIATLIAIAAARDAIDPRIRQKGMAGRPDLPRLCMYTSEQAHSSVEKGAITLGIGQEGVRKIPVDAEFRMDPMSLDRAIQEDVEAGWQPFCVTATVGTTSTTSIDPVLPIAQICRKWNLWLHVDGAYGGMAAVVPEMRSVLDGCEHADSIVVNPHKWLFTPIDCSAFYVRDPAILQRAFSVVPEYLRSREGDVTNYMDWGVQLGRRFRALKLWMVIRHFGQEGLAARIREHVRLAHHLARCIDADPDFERLAPTPLSTLCFRARPAHLAVRLKDAGPDESRKIEGYLDQLNEAIIEAVNATGEAFFSHTRLNGRYTIRMAIGNIRTSEDQVMRAWELVRSQASRLARKPQNSLE